MRPLLPGKYKQGINKFIKTLTQVFFLSLSQSYSIYNQSICFILGRDPLNLKFPGNDSAKNVLPSPFYAHLLFGDGVGGRGRTVGPSVVSGSRWDAADVEQVPHQQ